MQPPVQEPIQPPVQQPVQPPVIPPEQPVQKKRSRKPLWIIIAAVVLLLIAAGVILVLKHLGKNQEESSGELYGAERYYSYLSDNVLPKFGCVPHDTPISPEHAEGVISAYVADRTKSSCACRTATSM